MKTLWDFVGEQTAGSTTMPSQQREEEVGHTLSPAALDTLFQSAKTSPEAYERYRSYCYATVAPLRARTAVYATWQVGELWAIRYFVDDQVPTEQRYTGFQSEEDAIELLRHAAPRCALRKLTFKEFSADLVIRVQNESIN